MGKVVLSSFRADTPVDAETAKAANESAKRHSNEPPFPGGVGLVSRHWYLVVDTDTGSVSATTDATEAYPDQGEDQNGGGQS